MKRYGFFAVAIIVALGAASAHATEPLRKVNIIYLMPADRAYQPAYAEALTSAALDVQTWYRKNTNGTTFTLAQPIVKVLRTRHNAQWYATNGTGRANTWFWQNTLSDGFILTGGRFSDPENVWVFYIDADTACGQAIGGTTGVAILAANDLRGLTGGKNVPACRNEAPDTGGHNRWLGGLAHEIGHAFGLAHPAQCPGGRDASSIMCMGYHTYPNTFVAGDQIGSLGRNPFFSRK